MLKKLTFIGLFFLAVQCFGQGNPFLERDYWKNNPSINNVQQKIAEGHDISALTSSAFDAVSWALIEKTDNQTIKFLLTKEGNSVNKLTHDGRTYIFWAAYKDNIEMMQYLVDNGAKTDLVDNHGYSLFNFAATTGKLNTKLYDFCILHGSNPKKEKNHDGANALLLIAPFIKDVSLIDYFVEKGIDLKSTDNNGNGMFNYAAKTGNVQLMDYLIKEGITYRKPTLDGGNAMIFASRGIRGVTNTLETYQYLENLGIKPNITTNKGVTPLHSIAYRGKDLGIFNYFLSKGVDVNQADDNGNTPFTNAALLNKLYIVQHLSNNVTNINAADKKGRTALTNALRRNTSDVVKFLLIKGAKTDILDSKGNHLGYYLIQSYKPNNTKEFQLKAQLLQDNGFKFTKSQKDKNTLFHFGVDKYDIALLKWIHSKGVDVNTKNSDGLTPLQKAAMSAKNTEILKYLISIGADKSVKTDFDESVYDLASENELLQKNNIDIQFLK